MLKTNSWLAILALSVAVGFATTACAEKRVALLVGNNVYQNIPGLQTAVNDRVRSAPPCAGSASR
jgi:hypothetical protein